ncbi:MAG: sigma-70 family RNA polymerase sigma factor [Phycisphaerales bacterium]
MAESPSELPEGELSALIRAAGDGDERAWTRLVDLYARRVFALAKSRRLSAEMAEEITQSVFATIATKLTAGDYTEQGRFEAWLFRVAMNRVRDEMRRQKRQASPMDASSFALDAAPETGGQRASVEELDSLRGAMEKLSDADREIVELRHHAQLSFKQIADLLGEPMGTLLARHHRALKKLRDIIGTGSGEQGERKADAS